MSISVSWQTYQTLPCFMQSVNRFIYCCNAMYVSSQANISCFWRDLIWKFRFIKVTFISAPIFLFILLLRHPKRYPYLFSKSRIRIAIRQHVFLVNHRNCLPPDELMIMFVVAFKSRPNWARNFCFLGLPWQQSKIEASIIQTKKNDLKTEIKYL